MSSNFFLRGASVFVMAGALAACSDDSKGGSPPAMVSDMAMPTGTGGGGQPPPPPPADMAMPPAMPMLPFVVDTAFVSSGFMGDGATAGLVTMIPAKTGDSTDCGGMRSSTSAVGNCHSVQYAPPASGGMGWAGVYWQFPANNWGTKPGANVPAGATKVTFKAKGAVGGEKVTFLAGGIITPGNAYTDSLKATATVTLTADWADYSIDLSGQSYSQVLGGFGWTMAATDAATSGKFFVDAIEWQ
jgi:hypothetical protein